MNIWLVMLAGGLITFGIRLSFIYLFGRIETPPLVQRSLRFVPPAVLSAILVPEIVLHAGKLDLSLSNERLLAGLVAVATALVTKDTLLTILAGMGALLILRVLV